MRHTDFVKAGRALTIIFIFSYALVISNGTKNPLQKTVLYEITSAILRKRADKTGPALYWPRNEQERRLTAVFKKYEEQGNVWTASAIKVQLFPSNIFNLPSLICLALRRTQSSFSMSKKAVSLVQTTFKDCDAMEAVWRTRTKAGGASRADSRAVSS